ncbi:MAG TPA: HTH domain-containing protein, partial [Arachnia sp.]|nr:HTH domain-containing protein [Arachnia sp.]
MNRTDRLYALREELRRAGPRGRSAERLARTFEVSVRTIKRDISTLQHGGFPVWAQPGPGGGYVVDAAATLPPVNFTDAEVSGLAAAVAAHRGQPFDSHARAALAKVLSVMDATTRERSQRLGGRIWIDHEAGVSGSPQVRRAVEQALHERRVLSLRYRDEKGKETSRRVD